MKEYILELLKNGMWVFPVKGKGKTVDEAKKPLTFYEGDKEISWKSEEILSYSEELARKGHYAWGLWLLRSERFGIDMDVYKSPFTNKNEIRAKIIGILKDFKSVYSEVSAQGGIHIVLSTPMRAGNETYRLVVEPRGRYSWVEYKHDGYFIIYPSVLKLPSGEVRYEKIAGDLLNTEEVEIFYTTFREILRTVFQDDEVDVTLESVKSSRSKYKITGIRIGEIGIDLDGLTDIQVSALLYLLFLEAGCEGMAKALEWISEHRIVLIPKRFYDVMRIPRTTRFLFQHCLAGVMAWLGFSDSRIHEWMLSWKFIDEDTDPRKDSLSNALYNVFHYGILDLTPKGGCPWCWMLLKRESCGETPMRKVIKLPKEKILSIAELIRKHVRE